MTQAALAFPAPEGSVGQARGLDSSSLIATEILH